MKKIFAGMLVVMIMALFGCSGGGGSSGTTTDTTVKKEAAVTGTVSFPAISTLVAKQVAATVPSGTIIPPVLIVTDLSGAVIATPTLTVDSSNTKNFTYTVSLDASKNYVFKASWGGQVLRALADLSTLSTLSYVINITPVSTAAVLVAEKNLNLTFGKLGTTTASAITDAQVTALNPAALLIAVGTPTYATLVTAVTTALTGLTDPTGVAAVTTAVNTAPVYVPPVTTPATLTSLTVTPAVTSIVVGATQQFTATGTYSDASTKNLTTSVTWSSASISVATISTSGIATSVAAGTTTITATSGAIAGTTVLTATTPVTTPPTGFTSAMISGKTFSGTDSTGYFGTSTYNANGTTTGTDPSTWTINASGQLIETIIASGHVVTTTLTGVNGKSFTYSVSASNGYIATGTFTEVSSSVSTTPTSGSLSSGGNNYVSSNFSSLQPTLSSSGSVIYPVVNNFTEASIAGKTLALSIPGYGYAQVTLNNDGAAATATTPKKAATMTCTDFVKSGIPTGARTGTWGGSSSLSLNFPDGTMITLYPEAGDVTNNAFVSAELIYNIHDGVYVHHMTDSSGGSRIYMSPDPVAGLAQAAAYYTATSGTLPLTATQVNPVLTEASFVGRTMYISTVFFGYAKITFNTDHTTSISSMSEIAAPTQDLIENLRGTWALSGTNKLVLNGTDTITVTASGREAMYNGWKATLQNVDGSVTGVATRIFFDANNGLAQAAAFYQNQNSFQ